MPAVEDILKGKTAIVTGGGHGQGAESARALAAAGAAVCVADINPDRADHVAAAITAAGGEAFGWQMDISNKFQVSAMIEKTRDRYTHLDLLVQHAHVSPRESLLGMSEWNWRRTLEVNLTGTFLTAQLCARVMADERGGAIVLVQQTVRDEGLTEQGAVHASQQGIAGLATALGAELDGEGVGVAVLIAPFDPQQTLLPALSTLLGTNR